MCARAHIFIHWTRCAGVDFPPADAKTNSEDEFPPEDEFHKDEFNSEDEFREDKFPPEDEFPPKTNSE